jgi:hypothetical protein
MKKYLLICLISLGVINSFSSCEGFLDTEPTNVVVAETAMLTLYDAGIAVNGLYVDMKWYDYYGTYMQLMGDEREITFNPVQCRRVGLRFIR